jgi:hypothetical protein
MRWNVVTAKFVGGYRLALTFADGTSGKVNLTRDIHAGGVFARLADMNVFSQFAINPDFGTICCGDDLDVAPETLHHEVAGVPSEAMLREAPKWRLWPWSSPVEVKCSEAPGLRDAAHLRTFLAECPKAKEGIVVCRTARPFKLGPRIHGGALAGTPNPRRTPRMTPATAHRKLAAIMFTDRVGQVQFKRMFH